MEVPAASSIFLVVLVPTISYFVMDIMVTRLSRVRNNIVLDFTYLPPYLILCSFLVYGGTGGRVYLEALSFWSLNAYVHATVSISSTGTIAIYSNGVIANTLVATSLPLTKTRTYHWIGRSAWSGNGYLNAFVSYVRIYNSLSLTAADAATLFAQRYDCKAGMYGSSGSCTKCAPGYYSASSGTSSCSSCASGMYTASFDSSVCTACPGGSYQASSGSSSCIYCPAGYYAASTGSLSCFSCSTGYFSTTGATSCAASLHDFDFRGCTTGSSITDSFSIAATPVNGPTCSSSGMYFDGADDYVLLTNWNWGGATSFEVFVKHQVMNSFILDFGNGAPPSNNILLYSETSSTAVFMGACLNLYNYKKNTFHLIMNCSILGCKYLD
jgi:hypothetical protein